MPFVETRPFASFAASGGSPDGFNHLDHFYQHKEKIDTLPIALLPDHLTDIVLTAPTTNAQWRTLGINPNEQQDIYGGLVLLAFNSAARSDWVTKTFLDKLDDNPALVKNRLYDRQSLVFETVLHPELEERIHTPLLFMIQQSVDGNRRANREAQQVIVHWAGTRLTQFRRAGRGSVGV